MIVVAIIGILSAIAVPAFMRYIKKAKTAEVSQQLDKIATGARTYYLDEQGSGNLAPVAVQFPDSEALTPVAADNCCNKCTPAATHWETASWRALQFSVDDPHYYRYEFVSAGSGASASFTARAFGDLDCDNTLSTYERYGQVLYLGNDLTVQSGTWSDQALE